MFLKINVKTEFTTVNEAIIDVTKNNKLTEFPKFLQLHLLRYVFDQETKKVQKIGRKLAF